MNTQHRWIGYDTFKLMIALILLVILSMVFLRKPSVAATAIVTQDSQAAAVLPTQAPLSSTNTSVLTTATRKVQASATGAPVLPTATPQPPPTSTSTIVPPTATPAAEAQAAPTAPPELPAATKVPPTATPAAADLSTPTPITQPHTASVDCPLAQPSRLAAGTQALVLASLNLRKEAGIDKQIVRVILQNSKVEIVGGPICTPYQNGAYLWWNVKSADGITGWSAEASLGKSFYFLQPAP